MYTNSLGGNYFQMYTHAFTFTKTRTGMLHNKTILITGGGSGIGEALALQLSSENKIIICGRNEEKLKRVAAKHQNISYEVADLSRYESIEKLFAAVKSKSIILDVLFNNAGVVELWDLNRDALSAKEIFEKANTNLSAPLAVTQYFINQANKSKENLIVNNTSEIAILPVPVMPLYSASKTAFSVFTKLIRFQLKKTNFRVVELLTPGVDTDMPKQLNNSGKLMNVDDFARDVIANIAMGTREYAPGKHIMLMRFFQQFAPNLGMRILDRMSKKQLGISK